jgi:hypothetical protein
VAATQSGAWTVTGAGGTFPVTDSGGSLTVDNAALAVVGGGAEATALRVTVASDSTGVLSVDDNGASLTVDNAALSVTGGGVEATALRVTLASDSTGVISVDDNGGALTVDGTVTANAGTNLNTSALALEAGGNLAAAAASLATLDNIVAGSEAQVDVVTSALPSGASTSANQTTIIGHLDGVEGLLTTIDADTGSIATTNTTIAGAVSGTEMQVDVVAALPAGTNSIGAVTPQPIATGGLSIFRSLDLDETEEEVKGTAGTVYGWFITNRSTAALYVKFYNATAANVTVGTTTPVITLAIPGNATDDIAANALGGIGIGFDTAITLACTTGLADNDTGAPAANDLVINLFYI